ncbi:MAG: biotin carboxylase N-terminal domain-containing protein, partial [Bacteroidales bacterium]
IIRTAKRLGINTVVIYADHDRKAVHVSEADNAYAIGSGSLRDTYMNPEKISAVIQKANVDALHPGYGFLSENPALPELCHKQNILFVGPEANVMDIMGDKIKAREYARKAGVAISKGLTGTPREILQNMNRLEYPLLVKATAGGGGKAMRIVKDPRSLQQDLIAAARESKNYFNKDTVYVEHYFRDPRHIEVQILGDQHGNIIHLFERECSLQRRHQKVIEEAPSASVNDELRKILTESACKLAREINYTNAGTVEFLVDKDNKPYFLEMNTRIQVEHPVTEMITGLDMVELQIRIAEGYPLDIKQEDIKIHGHAIEARLYAENPAENYKPAPGTLTHVDFPEFEGIRIDHGLNSSDYISADYDPMIAKVIAHDKSRISAAKKLHKAMQNISVTGTSTNQELLYQLLEEKDFLANKISTQYLETNTQKLINKLHAAKNKPSPELLLAAYIINELHENVEEQKIRNAPDIWNEIGYWRQRAQMHVILNNKEYTILLKKHHSQYQLQIDDNLILASCENYKGNDRTVRINNALYKFKFFRQDNVESIIKYKGYYYPLQRLDLLKARDTESIYKEGADNSGTVVSPFHGRVVSIPVKVDTTILPGETLLIIESMKTENSILAQTNARISQVQVKEGEQVSDGQVLMILETK